MAKKPSKPKLVVVNDNPIAPNTEEEIEGYNSAFVLATVCKIASDNGFDPTEPLIGAELATILQEQWLSPHERATARWKRQANENLCHLIENDPRFREAWDKLKS